MFSAKGIRDGWFQVGQGKYKVRLGTSCYARKQKKMLEKKMTVCHEYARASLKASKALFIKGDIDKLDFIKISNFCSLKNIVEKKMKRQVTDWENICEIHIW